jgi:hypothetical protein
MVRVVQPGKEHGGKRSLYSPRDCQINIAPQKVETEKMREINIGVNEPAEQTAYLTED